MLDPSKKKSKTPSGVKMKYSGGDLYITLSSSVIKEDSPGYGCISIGLLFLVAIVLTSQDLLFSSILILITVVPTLVIGYFMISSQTRHIKVTANGIEVYKDEFGATIQTDAKYNINAIYLRHREAGEEVWSHVMVETPDEGVSVLFRDVKPLQAEYLSHLIQTHLQLEDFTPPEPESLPPIEPVIRTELPLKPDKIPQGIRINQHVDDLHIKLRVNIEESRKDTVQIFAIVFVWALIAGIFAAFLGSTSIFFLLASPMLLILAPLLYAAVATYLLEKTWLIISERTITVFERPLMLPFWLRMKTIDDVDFVYTSFVREGKDGEWCYITAVTLEGRQKSLVNRVSKDRGLYAAHTVQSYLDGK